MTGVTDGIYHVQLRLCFVYASRKHSSHSHRYTLHLFFGFSFFFSIDKLSLPIWRELELGFVSFSSNNTLGGEGRRMRCPWRNWFLRHWLPVLEITLSPQ